MTFIPRSQPMQKSFLPFYNMIIITGVPLKKLPLKSPVTYPNALISSSMQQYIGVIVNKSGFL